MKIHPDHIEGVRQSENQKANQTAKPQQAFGDVLGQEVSKANSTTSSAPIAPPPGLTVNPLFSTQAVSAVTSSVSEGEAVAQVERALETLESYADKLGDSKTGDLRQAYAALEDLQSGVEDLKGMADSHPGLKSVVDELEVLALTEQIKFNRGDYH